MKAKTKKEKAAPQADVATTAIKQLPAFERNRIDVALENLVPAPWNPRGEIPPESVADLVASIATVGVIEPVVAMPTEASLPNVTGPIYIIIAGHRRVQAARLAGLAAIPCDVLNGIDAATAKRLTFIENLQRKDADPLLESNLVAELVADGMTTDEIAAEIGRDRKWVLRRKNLANLSPSWRKRVAAGDKIAIDCLERIAAYPAETQEHLKGVGKEDYNRTEGVLRWSSISWEFAKTSRELGNACFDCAECLTCAKNTGCTPDLFDWAGGKPASLGQCLNGKCYERKNDSHIEALVKEAEKSGAKVIRKEPTYEIKTSAKRTKTCKVMYVYKGYPNSGLKFVWGEPPKAAGEKTKLSASEKVAREKSRMLNRAIRNLAAACTNTLAELLAMRFIDPDNPGEIQPYAPFAIMRAFVNLGSYRLHGCKSVIEDCAAAAINSRLSIPADVWSQTAAADIILQLDPKRYGAYANAKLLLAMFGELRDAIGPEDSQLILGTADTDAAIAKIINPTIAWNKTNN